MKRKVKETTTSGSIAPVTTAFTPVKKRGGNLLSGTKTSKKYANSLSESQDLSEEEIQEEELLRPSHTPSRGGFIPRDQRRVDHEVSMAVSDLLQCGKNAEIVYNILRGVSEEQGIPGWVQEKITKATDYLNTVAEYMEGEYHQHMAHNRLYDSRPSGGYGVIAGGTTMENNLGATLPIFHGSDKPAQPWAAIDRIAGGVREETMDDNIDEASYSREHHDADVWYRIGDDGLMYQRSWMHGSEGEARANGWSDTREKALLRRGIIRSKFDPNKFVRKDPVTQKWIQVFPYGRPEDKLKEAATPAQQAAIAVNMKKQGKKPKNKQGVAEVKKNNSQSISGVTKINSDQGPIVVIKNGPGVDSNQLRSALAQYAQKTSWFYNFKDIDAAINSMNPVLVYVSPQEKYLAFTDEKGSRRVATMRDNLMRDQATGNFEELVKRFPFLASIKENNNPQRPKITKLPYMGPKAAYYTIELEDGSTLMYSDRSPETFNSLEKAQARAAKRPGAKVRAHHPERTPDDREGRIEPNLFEQPRNKESEGVAEGWITEKAKSKKQQQFFGMVRAMQKGKKIKGASAELKKAAKDISKGDVKDFAKTKHKGLPTRVDESVEDIETRLSKIWNTWSKK